MKPLNLARLITVIELRWQTIKDSDYLLWNKIYMKFGELKDDYS